MVWSYDNKLDSVPDFEYVKNYNYIYQTSATYNDLDTVFNEEKDEPEQSTNRINLEKECSRIIDDYIYHTEDVDLEIAKYIENGQIDTERLEVLLSQIDANYESGNAKNIYSEYWSKQYYSHFNDNKNEFINNF